MPVRIYDISKKLGLENKEVLAKAKSLGIAAARVASSSLDKITAEYLEQQIIQDNPNLAALPVPPSALPVGSASQSIAVVSPPAPETESSPKHESATATALLEAEPPGEAGAPPAQAEGAGSSSGISEPPPPAEPEMVAESEPAAPPPPPGPKVGDKVGFIQLPTKPVAKVAEKTGGLKPPSRPVEPRKTEFTRRGDIRSSKSRRTAGRTREDCLAGRRAGHFDQTADRRARTGRAAKAKAVQNHR